MTTLPGFEHIHRYFDREHHCPAAKILPGEFYVTRDPEAIATLLGSCVSACLRDPAAKVGGMNHFMLPDAQDEAGRWGADCAGKAARYGSYAMEQLINEVLKHGGRRPRLEVKIAGGGRILASMTDIGERNIRFVEQYLHTEGLRLLAEDVGGTQPRKVLYFPATGVLKIKKLRAIEDRDFIERERRYRDELTRQPDSGGVDLF